MNRINWRGFLATVIAGIGVFLIMISAGDVGLLLKGDKIILSESKMSDSHEPVLIEGDVFSIQRMATGYNDKFPYNLINEKICLYMIVNISKSDWENALKNGDTDVFYSGFYIIYAVSDEEMIKKCDAAADKSVEYIKKVEKGDINAEVPDLNLKFEGRTVEQPDGESYANARDNYISNSNMSKNQFADLMIRDGKVGFASVFKLIIGIVLILASIILMVFPYIQAHIRAKREELW